MFWRKCGGETPEEIVVIGAHLEKLGSGTGASMMVPVWVSLWPRWLIKKAS